MAKSYMADKALNKKSAMKGVWLVVIIAIIIILIFARYALSDVNDSYVGGMPGSDDVYNIAKDFLRPAVKSEIDFPESGFQFGKQSDSVFVIRSYFEEKDPSGGRIQKKYQIVMKYNGGSFSNINNWSVVNMDTNL